MTRINHGYPKFRADDANGVPYAGAQLFTYEEGTSTKATTYSSQTGAANDNPIILDANGECDLWYEGSLKLVLAPAGDTDPPASPIWTQDNIAGGTYPGEWVAATLENSWVNEGSGTYYDAKYRKNSSGEIVLVGRIKNGTATGGTTLLTLPANHRPSDDVAFPVVSNSVFGYVIAHSDGTVTIEVGNNTYLDFGEIRFLAE